MEIPVELIHRIQSLLTAKQAVRTSVLSKSWLHAYSTIPTISFPFLLLQLLQNKTYNDWIDSTLLRYQLNNITIKSFYFAYLIKNHESARLVEKWIRLIASKSSCLKELSLHIGVDAIDSFTLPHEILFSSKNLNTINVLYIDWRNTNPVSISSNLVIKCVSLRVLKLEGVGMSDYVLNKILSTCRLLEKIKLVRCIGLKTVKVKNLPCLRELKLFLVEKDEVLEFDNIPSLDLFKYRTSYPKSLPFKTDSLRSVTQLRIHGVIIDNSFLEIIESKFPSLESLSLMQNSYSRGLEESSLVITSISLKMLHLSLLWGNRPIEVHVYAPKLISFSYYGATRPSVLFPTIAPKEIKIRVTRT